jgi:hypothetical protein
VSSAPKPVWLNHDKPQNFALLPDRSRRQAGAAAQQRTAPNRNHQDAATERLAQSWPAPMMVHRCIEKCPLIPWFTVDKKIVNRR